MGKRQKPVQKKPRKNELKSNIAPRNSLVEEEIPGAVRDKVILLLQKCWVFVGLRAFVLFFRRTLHGPYNEHEITYNVSRAELTLFLTIPNWCRFSLICTPRKKEKGEISSG